jgi:UDP-N-acetylmuramate dehydrogenase
MIIREQATLAPYTTLRVGGPARYFAEVQTDAEVKEAIMFARTREIPFFILGGGSNVLFSDEGFSGLVIAMRCDGIVWEDADKHMRVIAEAGVVWDLLVQLSVERGLFGLENLSAIPGSVGASVVQNIGAYGIEASRSVEWIDVYDTVNDVVRRITKDDALFGYRESIFKHEEGKHFVVLRVSFLLHVSGALLRAYKDIVEYEKNIQHITSVRDMREAVIAIRAKKFPDLEKFGTAGSFFKNPVVDDAVAQAFLLCYPEATHYKAEGGKTKLSAAWIIDHALHMRGVREGHVGTWEAQALVVITDLHASSREIIAFTSHISDACNKKIHIFLTPEVVIVSNNNT